MPAERGLVAIGFRADSFFGGGDGVGAKDRSVGLENVEALGGNRDPQMSRRGHSGRVSLWGRKDEKDGSFLNMPPIPARGAFCKSGETVLVQPQPKVEGGGRWGGLRAE